MGVDVHVKNGIDKHGTNETFEKEPLHDEDMVIYGAHASGVSRHGIFEKFLLEARDGFGAGADVKNEIDEQDTNESVEMEPRQGDGIGSTSAACLGPSTLAVHVRVRI